MPDQNQSPTTIGGLHIGGASLYEVVETYAGFGPHLTGSDADWATTAWLTEMLEGLGVEVQLLQFEFERYICTAHLRSGGAVVPSLPLFYSGYGRWETSNIQVVELDKTSVAGRATSLAPLVKGPAGNRALAVALNGPDDLPVQCNRIPPTYGVATGPGQPAVVIPRNWADRVRDNAELSFDASLETSSSQNIVATFGSPEHRRVTVTTPLTGWTACAGERGTGLAAAIALALDLATDHYVVLVCGSGHELDHLGTRSYLSMNNVANQPVVHIGASVGAVEWSADGTAILGSKRSMMTTASGSIANGLAERAAAGRFSPASPDDWPGEGGTWKEAGAAVLSFLGSFDHFHVETDLPEAATTPEALELATTTIINTSRHFLAADRL